MREYRDVGRAAADVEQAHAEILLVLGQHGARRRERLQDQVLHFDAATAHALDDVLRRGHRAGHDVHLHLQAHARHADRLAHVFLAVDDEFLAQHVQDLLVGRNVDRAGGLDRAVDVEHADLAVLHRDHPRGIEAPDVAAGDADESRADLAVGHQLGFLERALDRGHRRLDVDHDALFQAFRFVRAHAQDVERLGHQARHLRGADVQRDHQVLVFLRHQPFTRTAKPLG